eukprot:COSAG06_NODE_155_length_21876_cov_22.287643_17_plen_49_part_00
MVDCITQVKGEVVPILYLSPPLPKQTIGPGAVAVVAIVVLALSYIASF